MPKHFIRYWLPLIIFSVLIFYLSSLPLNKEKTGNIKEHGKFPMDIVYHLIEFSFLGVLSYRTFKNSRKEFLSRNHLLLAISFAILYGILDEIHQSYVPTRYFELKDVISDAIGSLFIALIRLMKF